MTTTPGALRKLIVVKLLDALAPLGFIAKGQFLVRRRDELVTDWLAVMTVGQRGGGIDATVNAGIHCAPLHRLLASLNADAYAETTATFSTNVGYIEPGGSYRQWHFSRELPEDSLLVEMANTVRHVAIPFCVGFTDADSLREGCKRYGFSEYNQLRIPALEYLAGRAHVAKEHLEIALSAMERRTDAAADLFRAAGSGLLTLCTDRN